MLREVPQGNAKLQEPLLSGDHKQSDLEAQVPPSQDKIDALFHDNFKPEEIKALEKQYGCNYQTLKDKINQHWCAFRAVQIEASLALIPEVPFMGWQISRGSEGIKSGVKQIRPDIELSDSAAFWTNVPLTGVDFIFNVHTFGPTKAAVLQALSYAFWSPAKDLKEYVEALKSEPCKTFCNTTKALASGAVDQFACLTHNATGAAANFVETLSIVPDPYKVAVSVVLTFLGMENYRYFCNSDYYESKTDFWQNKKLPSLLSEVRKGNLAIPAEIFLQGMIAGVGLRTATFYGIALAVAEVFGAWIPASVVAVAVFIHSLCTRYPSTYSRYMGDELAIRDMVANLCKDEIDTMIQQSIGKMGITLSAPEQLKYIETCKENVMELLTQLTKNLVNKELRQSNRNGYKADDVASLIPATTQAAIGGYWLGWQSLTPAIAACSVHPAVQVLSYTGPVIGALVCGGPSFKAEMNRIHNGKVKELLEEKLKGEEDVKAVATTSKCEKALKVLSYIVTSISQGQRCLTSMGVLEKLSIIDLPGARAFGMGISIKQSLNGIIWTGPKVFGVFKARYLNKKASVTGTPATMYSQARNAPEMKADLDDQPQNSSWCCWRNRGKQ